MFIIMHLCTFRWYAHHPQRFTAKTSSGFIIILVLSLVFMVHGTFLFSLLWLSPISWIFGPTNFVINKMYLYYRQKYTYSTIWITFESLAIKVVKTWKILHRFKTSLQFQLAFKWYTSFDEICVVAEHFNKTRKVYTSYFSAAKNDYSSGTFTLILSTFSFFSITV